MEAVQEWEFYWRNFTWLSKMKNIKVNDTSNCTTKEIILNKWKYMSAKLLLREINGIDSKYQIDLWSILLQFKEQLRITNAGTRLTGFVKLTLSENKKLIDLIFKGINSNFQRGVSAMRNATILFCSFVITLQKIQSKQTFFCTILF